MKKLILTIFLAAIGLLVTSCERDINEPVISSNPGAPALANLSMSADFTVNNGDSLITFTWSKADFGFQSSTTYAIQVSPTSNFSKNVATLTSSNTLSATAKIKDLNTLILSWNYNIGTPVSIYYRIAATVNPNVDTLFTAAKNVSITPYDAVINYPMVYAPGSYQGWAPGNDNGKLFSYNFDSKYQNTIRFVNGSDATIEFKITSAASWSGTNWGGTLTKTGSSYSGTLDPSGGNFQIVPGTYVVNVDVNALTISLTKTDDWGIIGSACANGWNSSVPMFYNGQRKVWEITTNLVAGEFKFRANDAWDLNYGDNGADGTLEAGGANIAIAASGNYTIRFDPVAKTYTVKKN